MKEAILFDSSYITLDSSGTEVYQNEDTENIVLKKVSFKPENVEAVERILKALPNNKKETFCKIYLSSGASFELLVTYANYQSLLND